jgi:hypothetical protein
MGSILFLGTMIMENMSPGPAEVAERELSGYKVFMEKIDFKLLLNEHTYRKKGEDKN